MLAGGKVSDHC